MKNKIKNFVCFSVSLVLALSGCSSDKLAVSDESYENYVNLDITGIVVEENTPESGEWYSLQFNYDRITKDSFSILSEAAKYFGVSDMEKGKVLCSVDYDSNDPTLDIAYPEMDDDDSTKTLYMRYIDDDLFISYNCSNRIELYNRKLLREINGEDYDSTWEWKPGRTGENNYQTARTCIIFPLGQITMMFLSTRAER